MGYNFCQKCGFDAQSPGTGRMPDPQCKWLQFWKTVPCDACGGDGFAKPPGWPDCAEINRLRPTPPPPKASASSACCGRGVETGFVKCGGYQPKAEQIDWSEIEYPTTDDVLDADR